MKKIFTLCLALMALASMPAMAQDDEEDEIDPTLEFVDEDGNVVPDGSQIVRNTLEDDGMQYKISSGLFVNNTTEDNVFTAAEVNISRLDNGSISCCFPLNCIQKNESFISEPGQMTGGEKHHTLHSEWIVGENEETLDPLYGEAVVQFRLRMYDTKIGIIPSAGEFLGYGPSVTITFINPDPTGITSITKKVSEATVSAIYNLRGEQLSKMQKGINIVRYADGTTKKVIK